MGSISEWWEQRRVSEPEDMTKKLPNLNNREKADCKKKKKESLRDLWDYNYRANIHVITED